MDNSQSAHHNDGLDDTHSDQLPFLGSRNAGGGIASDPTASRTPKSGDRMSQML